MDRFESYIEKAVTRFNVKGPQREKLTQELRLHLEQFAAHKMDKGFPRAEAELQAVESMGPLLPQVISWRQGLVNALYIFSIIGLLYLLTRYFHWNEWNELERFVKFLFLGSCGMLCITTAASHLDYRRFISRSTVLWKIMENSSSLVPGNLTFSVWFNAFRITGKGKRWVFPGTRLYAFALKTLGADVFDTDALALLNRKLIDKPESRTKQWVVTVVALVSAGLVLRELTIYPDGNAVSAGYLVALIASSIISWYQAIVETNRTKVALFGIVGFLTLGLFVLSAFAGMISFTGFPALLVFLLILLGLLISLTWWKSHTRKIGIVIVLSTIALPAMACGHYLLSLPRVFQSAFKVKGIANSIDWINGNPSAIATISNHSKGWFITIQEITENGAPLKQSSNPIESGAWNSVPRTQADPFQFYLMDGYLNDAEGPGIPYTDTYLLKPDHSFSKVVRSYETYDSSYLFGKVVSPDQRDILLIDSEWDGPKKIAIQPLDGRSSQTLAGYPMINFWRWTGDHQAEFLAEDPTTSGTFQIRQIDTRDLSTTAGQLIQMPRTYKPSIIKSDQVIVFYDDLELEYNSPFGLDRKTQNMIWLSVDDGTSFSLPDTAGQGILWDWNAEKSLIAYRGLSNFSTIYIADKTGLQDLSFLEKGYQLGWLSLSPDGRKVIYIDNKLDSPFWEGSRLRLWDRDTGKTETLCLAPGANSIYGYFRYGSQSKVIQWLPDGSGFLWAHLVYNRDPALYDEIFPAMDTQFYRYEFKNEKP